MFRVSTKRVNLKVNFFSVSDNGKVALPHIDVVAKSKIKLILSESSQDSERENRIRHQHHFGGTQLASSSAKAKRESSGELVSDRECC